MKATSLDLNVLASIQSFLHIDGLVKDCSNSIANALVLCSVIQWQSLEFFHAVILCMGFTRLYPSRTSQLGWPSLGPSHFWDREIYPEYINLFNQPTNHRLPKAVFAILWAIRHNSGEFLKLHTARCRHNAVNFVPNLHKIHVYHTK